MPRWLAVMVIGTAACGTTASPTDPCAFNVPESARNAAKSATNTAPMIESTSVMGGAPAAPMGGTVVGGTYYLASDTYYYDVSPAGTFPEQETLVVDATAHTLVQVKYVAGVYGQRDGNVATAAAYTTQGTTMTWAMDACTDTTFTHQATLSFSYTATGTQIILQNMGVGPATYAATVYTRQ